jgi:Ca-activated chloride channel family protein
MFQLGQPWWLLLLPLPWLIARVGPAYHDRVVAVRVPFLDRVADLTGQEPGRGSAGVRAARGQRWLNLLLWLLVVAALARPQWLEEPVTKTLPMRDLLVAVDLSGSMETRDFLDDEGRSVERLAAVKQVLGDCLARREGDRVALVVFGSAAFTLVPFTEDRDVVVRLLDETTVRMAGPRTMLGDAIGLAITLFERSEVEDRMMILLTDGNDTGSAVPPRRAAEIARDKQVVIHPIGVGDPTAAGEEALDEETLEAIAATTGGRAFHADDREELASIHAELDQLAPRKVETLSHRPQRDLFHWPLGAALLASLAYHGLSMGPRAVARLRRRDEGPGVVAA